METHINTFLPVMIIDEDGAIDDPNTERIVSLPGIPCF